MTPQEPKRKYPPLEEIPVLPVSIGRVAWEARTRPDGTHEPLPPPFYERFLNLFRRRRRAGDESG